MPKIENVQGRTQLEIERFDGGLNTKDSPSRISVFESPECLNVVFDDQGSVATRLGSAHFNTSVVETGSQVCDGMASYRQTMVVAFGGTLYRTSGTTFVTISSSQGQFTTGAKVAFETYQNILFCSEGTSGPWRYEGGDSFYRMGIAVPSAPTGACNVAGAGMPAPGTYYYKIAYANSHVVAGEPGSASAGVVLTASSAVNVTSIPTAAASLGVSARWVYRASQTSGDYRRVGVISDNAASIFTDTMAATTWAVSPLASDDATAPTPFTTIKLHKERLFFDDSSNRTLLRYTDFETPFISQAENFVPLNKGDGSNITAIGVQDDLVTVFKDASAWVLELPVPGDDTTWQYVKVPGNMGIVGPRALTEIPNGILFAGKENGRITGFHILSGLTLEQTASDLMRTTSMSERIETDVLAFESSLWDDIAMVFYNNKVYISCAIDDDTVNSHMYWFDINRRGDKGQPGSWSLWDGLPGQTNALLVHSGSLYGGASAANGRVYKLEIAGSYIDQATAINSYFWTKEYGGEGGLDSWIKDFRKVNLWYELAGDWYMNLRYRIDGDQSDGVAIPIDLNPGGSLWGSGVWGTSTWGGDRLNFESQHSLGSLVGRRIQLRFDNQNTVSQWFKVHSAKIAMNARRQK